MSDSTALTQTPENVIPILKAVDLLHVYLLFLPFSASYPLNGLNVDWGKIIR